MKRPVLIAAALIALGVAAWLWPQRPQVTDQMLRQARAELLAELESLWNKNGMRRSDGYVYAVDVGHLLIHATYVGDLALYKLVKSGTLNTLIIDNKDDPYTKGFVGWRVRKGRPVDASGTTEALRVARGLWAGSHRFNLPEDRTLALKIIDGYRRHAYIDQGVWLVRNYFNFATRSFANDSFLVDYDPDLIQEMAAATDDPELTELARRSYGAVQSAVL